MSVYRTIDIIATSPDSCEDAAKEALTTARKSLRHLQVAEVSESDITVNDTGEIEQFRTKLSVSFKYQADEGVMPALGLSKSATQYPFGYTGYSLVAHLVSD